jgi:PRC-barrel domain
MLKTFLATTAIASLATFGVFAQTSSSEQTPATVENQLAPADAPAAEADGTILPEADESAQDPAAAMPETTAEDADSAAPDAPMQAEDQPATGIAPAGAPMQEGYTEVDVATLSADNLMGTSIQTHDDESIAEVTDVILSSEGQVENVVAQFGGVLGFGADKVLLSMDDIEVLKDPNDNLVVRTSLTPEELEARPPYEG